MIDASKYVGLEFDDAQRHDCWWLVKTIYREQLGIDLPSYTDDYKTSLDGDDVSALVTKERLCHWEEVTKEDARPGDVVVLRIKGRPWHCGVLMDYPKFIHMEFGVNACVERLDSVRWSLRLDGIYRYKHV